MRVIYKSFLLLLYFFLTFLLKLPLPGITMFSFFLLFYRLKMISAKVCVIGFLVTTVIIATISTIAEMFKSLSNKKYKAINWLTMNYSKYYIYIMLFAIGFISMETELVWSIDDLKDAISLEWTIYGISMTIFLVWNVLIVEYLKRRKPEVPKDTFPTYTLKYIQEKGSFYELASTFFNSVSFLSINTFLLISASCVAYMSPAKATLFGQNITIFSFFVSTNTLVSLFTDVLRPLKDEQKALLKGTKVTDKDVELQNRIDSQVSKTLSLLDEVDKMVNLDEEQRKMLRIGILENFQKINETELSLVPEDKCSK